MWRKPNAGCHSASDSVAWSIGEALPTLDSQVNQINSSDALFESGYHLSASSTYCHTTTLPDSLLDKLFPKRGIPIFSSTDCDHLVTLSEFIAMYLLVWSPTLWQCINRERLIDNDFKQADRQLTPAEQQQWRDESIIIDDQSFVAEAPASAVIVSLTFRLADLLMITMSLMIGT